MVFTEGTQDKYLDEDGLQYLIEKLKEKIPSSGNVDLSDYYTKEEIDTIVNNLPAGGTGTSGKDGTGIQMVKLVNYELIVTLTDGTEINLGNVRGADGVKGDKGDKGDPGQDGAKGADGVSPTVEVTEITGGHTVAITDKNGTKTFDVLNGKDGASGSGGGSSSGGGDVYSMDETPIGTWYDGSTIYRKVVIMKIKTTIKSGTPDITSVKHGIENFKYLVDLRCIPQGYSMKSAIGDLGFTGTNLYNASSLSNLRDYLIRPTVSYDSIMVDAGYSWRGCELTCIIEYTKSN